MYKTTYCSADGIVLWLLSVWYQNGVLLLDSLLAVNWLYGILHPFLSQLAVELECGPTTFSLVAAAIN